MSQIKQEYEEQTFNNYSDIDDAKDAGFGKLPVVNSGVNMKGDAWCCHSEQRDCYHYVNQNGSIYYKNPDKSFYYWDPRGFSRYIDPQGRQYLIRNPVLDVELNRFCFSCDEELTPSQN